MGKYNSLTEAQQVVLELLESSGPIVAAEVKSRLSDKLERDAISKAIFELWDYGYINVRLDQKLEPVVYLKG